MNNLFLNLLIKQRLRSILKKQWLLLLAFPCLVILFSLKMPASFGRTILYMGLMLLFSLSCFIEKGFEAESTYFDGLISWHSNSLKHIFICNNLFIIFQPLFGSILPCYTKCIIAMCHILLFQCLRMVVHTY